MNSETFLQNKKREEKYSNSKNFVSPDTLSGKFQPIVQNLQHFIFSFLFFCIKFLFYNFIVCVIFLNQYLN